MPPNTYRVPLITRAGALGSTLLLIVLAGCDTFGPEDCPAVGIGLEGGPIDALRVGEMRELQALPNLCLDARAEVEWVLSDTMVARLVPTGAHTATLLAVSPGEGLLVVRERGAPAGSELRAPYRVPAPALPQIEREDERLIQTDSVRHTLRVTETGWSGEIGMLFTNARTDTVHIHNCGGATPMALQRWSGERWEDVFVPAIPPCVSPAIRVPPGGTHRNRLRVFVAFPWSSGADRLQTGELPGIHRVVWGGVLRGGDVGEGSPLPEEQRISNRFLLTVTPGGG